MANNGSYELKLEDMQKYVCEWLVNPVVEIAEVVGHSDEEAYTITQNQEVIYVQIFKKGDYNKDAIVSTNGIINDELRGCVEQCIAIDRQLEENKKESNSVFRQKIQ